MYKKIIKSEDLDFNNSARPDSHPSDQELLIIFHVDDFGLSVHPCCASAAKAFMQCLLTRFHGKDLGIMDHYVGIDIHQVKDCIYLTQSTFVQDLVDKLGLTDCNSVLSPMEPNTRLLDSDSPAIHDSILTREFQHIVGCLQFLNQWT